MSMGALIVSFYSFGGCLIANILGAIRVTANRPSEPECCRIFPLNLVQFI